MNGRPLSQAEIEEALQAEIDHLEAITNGGESPKYPGQDLMGYDTLCELAADAESDWKIENARGLLHQNDNPPGGRHRPEAKHIQEARVLAMKADLYRTYKRTQGAKEAGKEALYSARARVNALQTMSANVRGQT